MIRHFPVVGRSKVVRRLVTGFELGSTGQGRVPVYTYLRLCPGRTSDPTVQYGRTHFFV